MNNDGSSRIGVDVGGTFTDIVTFDDGQIGVTKTSSTPDAPERGVLNGIEKADEQYDFSFDEISFFGHGTTVATNAVLEKTWAATALVTTAGCRDVLEIGRQARPDIYDFQAEKPKPIVERDRRFEVPERLDERGDVLTELDESQVENLADRLSDLDVESVAICLLFSFENDDHERRVEALLEEVNPDCSYSVSSTVHPEIREYERTLVTSLNAALKPVMAEYVGNLRSEIEDRGIPAQLRLMQSNGGIIAADAAREQPVNTLLSGPAAGVQGATYIADRCGLSDIITMDMGGTSCDVSLVEDGDPLVATDLTVGEYPVSVPMIDIHTVGAGGGSIARIDEGGALRVGPQSAGADPGPICYGRGGTRPTLTDAHLLLGRLNPRDFLSGELDTETDDVRQIVEREIADPLDQSVEEAAQGILDIANANMARALRVVSVERGYDPREFGLVAFGGAGPLHACVLASELDVPRVVIPRTAGVLSALGLLISDMQYDYSTSQIRALDTVDTADLRSIYEDFTEQGREELTDAGLSDEQHYFERRVDLRYAGQAFELSIPIPDSDLDTSTLETTAERFHERHEQRYGHAYRDEPIELVTIRLRARGVVETPDLRATRETGTIEDAITETRTVRYAGDDYETRIYERDALPTDSQFEGPAIVESDESTATIHPGQQVRIDEYGNLLVEVTNG